MSETNIYRAVVGTNSWGSKAYGRMLRGSSVDRETLRQTVREAMDKELAIFDTAQDYGLGMGQKLIGELCPKEAVISAKYTPGTKYSEGQVRRSFEKDLKDFRRDHVDIYWLHLPNCIEQNLSEMTELYKEGRIGNIGISNFTLDECKRAKSLLDAAGVPLFGVQNHYSILAREWEKNGLVDWCRENGVQFWAWAVLEEGLLVPPKKGGRLSLMKLIYLNRQSRLLPLYKKMHIIGRRHGISPAQVAMAFCSSKGIVPICGCRKPYQADELDKAVKVQLTEKEISVLEQTADSTGVKILGADMFRFAVGKRR
ncbi:Predicted oxidoreductase [Ruminococcus sp. YE71]|uniref:aldo/keto reductase n=1 Tax=unclassified Ruminococcus TaxID=2608920 RepID=UPI0008843637|nr:MULTISPECIES: aldo/keto reductase [unclassified Ruminococcus]SDA26007.1 Predicted oxidoreductase [Ruminococcus sp. YE78]SFW35772.1 Predicted oxidoreductase [Ruminococcus sp. YE71]